MKFNNLDCNILYVLGENRSQSGKIMPAEVSQIYSEFSDIPVESLAAELTALGDDGMLYMHNDDQKLSLTSKGMAEVESMHRCQVMAGGPSQQRSSRCCAIR